MFFETFGRTYRLKKIEPHQEGHGGHNKLILVGSVEAEMIADIKEEGLSLLVAMHQVNKYRRTKGLGHVGWSAVRSAYIRMCSVVTKIMPCAQGSTDPESLWAKARLLWVTQLALRFGILKLEDCTPTEAAYCQDMPPLHFGQVCHWDETHKKVLMGLMGKNKNKQCRFPRDEDGKADVEHGTLRKRSAYLPQGQIY